MKAVLCRKFCAPDELELADLPEPVAGPGEAVVRIKAAALNFFDTLIIAGKYQHKPPFPFSPAAEFSGVVESVGAGVTDVAPGDRVMGNTGWGAIVRAGREAAASSSLATSSRRSWLSRLIGTIGRPSIVASIWAS